MRTKKFFISFVTGSIRSVIGLLLGFIATPYLLKFLGDEKYGAFKVLTDLMGYISLLEFGLYGSLLSLFVKGFSEKANGVIDRIYHIGLRYYFFVGLASFVIGLICWPFLTLIIPISEQNVQDLSVSYLLLLSVFLLLPFYVSQASLEAQQKSYHTNVANSLNTMSYLAFAVFLSWKGWGLKGLVIATLFSSLLSSIYTTWWVRKDFFNSLFRVNKKAEAAISKDFWKLQWPTLFLNLGGRVCLLTDNLIISVILGPKKVVPFFMTQRLIQVVQMQIQGFGSSTWAGLGEIYFEKKYDLFNQRLIDLTKLLAVMAGTALVPCIAFNKDFVTTWVGANQYAGASITVIVALNAFFLSVLTLWGWCFSAVGMQKLLLPQMIVQSVLNLSLNIVLTLKLGIVGPILATLISYIFVPMWWIPNLLFEQFKVSRWPLFRAWLVPFILSVGSGVLAMWARQGLEPVGWLGIVLQMSLLGFVQLGVLYVLVFNRDEKVFYWNTLKRIFSRRLGR